MIKLLVVKAKPIDIVDLLRKFLHEVVLVVFLDINAVLDRVVLVDLFYQFISLLWVHQLNVLELPENVVILDVCGVFGLFGQPIIEVNALFDDIKDLGVIRGVNSLACGQIICVFSLPRSLYRNDIIFAVFPSVTLPLPLISVPVQILVNLIV